MPLTTEQLALRKNSIGSSDVAALLGVSPWATPYDLWLEKTGRLPDPVEKPWMRVGSRLEAGVLDEFEEAHGPIERGVLIERVDLRMACNVDGILIAGREPIEAKTAGLFGPLGDEWGDEGSDAVPVAYVVQAHAHMIVLNAPLCHVPALLGGIGFRDYRVQRSERLADAIMARCESFWRVNVQGDTPPDAKGSPDILKMTRREPGLVARLPSPMRDAFEQAAAAKRDAEKNYEATVAAIRQADPAAEAFDFGDPAKWFTDYEQGRETLDSKALKAEHPEIYEKYRRESRFRVLRLSKRPKGEK
jgi:putative phage-type endonuclease